MLDASSYYNRRDDAKLRKRSAKQRNTFKWL